MLYLFDTNAISDLINNHAKLVDRLSKVRLPDRAIICPVIRGEVLYGIERLPMGKRRTHLTSSADSILRTFPCVAIEAEAGDAFSLAKRACEAKGASIAENDLWIAATALMLGATVVTRDADLFRVPNLRVEDWTR